MTIAIDLVYTKHPKQTKKTQKKMIRLEQDYTSWTWSKNKIKITKTKTKGSNPKNQK